MISAYQAHEGSVVLLPPDTPLTDAMWIDLCRPTEAETAAIAGLKFKIDVPTLADMEEIEISNRLYRDSGIDYMTVVLPGLDGAGEQISGPVCFILTPDILLTVRHHSPRPFDTYPTRADKNGIGCHQPARVLLGLIEEITGRLADLLEGVGQGLDSVSRKVYRTDKRGQRPEVLQESLARVGQEGERLDRVRLSLLTLQRAVNFFGQSFKDRPDSAPLGAAKKALLSDILALEVHADFLSSRLSLASDATLGMINLSQNATVRIVSVVAVLFLPPTLIASIYGMNFVHMPELDKVWGYPMALGIMIASAVLTWVYFRWRGWL